MVAPPGECLRVKADIVLFAGNTVWTISERAIQTDVTFTFTLPVGEIKVIKPSTTIHYSQQAFISYLPVTFPSALYSNFFDNCALL